VHRHLTPSPTNRPPPTEPVGLEAATSDRVTESDSFEDGLEELFGACADADADDEQAGQGIPGRGGLRTGEDEARTTAPPAMSRIPMWRR
jgi:hypothetical protein